MWENIWCKTQHDATHESEHKQLQQEKRATNNLTNYRILNTGHFEDQTSAYLYCNSQIFVKLFMDHLELI